MAKIKLSEFSEEIRYVIACPECGDYLEESDNPRGSGQVHCDGCNTLFDIEDDTNE